MKMKVFQRKKSNYAVIMAGGIGERFWPLSRQYRPKQFIDILGTGKTLLQQTYSRLEKIIDTKNIFVITNQRYKSLVLEQIKGINPKNVICEPTRKNTGPCIAYATWKIKALDPKACLVVAPSDHLILNEAEFLHEINLALEAASQHQWLFTLGIKPSRPDTGYGYIQYVDGIVTKELPTLKKVKTFTEKPTLELAESFLESGDFLWNSGIFIWSASAIVEAFEKFEPEISFVFSEAEGLYNTPAEETYMNTAFATCKSIAIDYAILEKADNVHVFAAEFEWTDLGTWTSLHENTPKDKNNNSVSGRNVILNQVTNCILNVPNDKIVVVQGLDGYIVAESDNALLICPKDKEQEIKKYIAEVKNK